MWKRIKALGLNFTTYVDSGHLEKLCIKNFKTRMHIWHCLRAFKANILVFSSKSSHLQWKSEVLVSSLGVKGQFGSNNSWFQLSYS